MEKLRQKAITPELKMMMRDEHIDSCVLSQSKTPLPSRSIAGTAKIMVAKGAM